MTIMPRADGYDGPPTMTPDRVRRLQDRQRERERAARAAVEATPAAERFASDRMTPATSLLDAAYVSGAPVRSIDPEVRRLRRWLRESA